MLADPQTLTVSTVAVPLPRIPAGSNQGMFRNADGSLTLTVSHQNGKRERTLVRIDRSKIGSDVLDDSRKQTYKNAVWLVIDSPLNGVGFTDAEIEADCKALTGLVNSNGFLPKILGKEA